MSSTPSSPVGGQGCVDPRYADPHVSIIAPVNFVILAAFQHHKPRIGQYFSVAEKPRQIFCSITIFESPSGIKQWAD